SILRLLVFMRFTLPSKRFGVSIETAEGPHQVWFSDTEANPTGGERPRVRRLHRAEAPVATPVISGAEGTATGVGHGPQAGRAARHHHTHRPMPLALDADAVCGSVRFAPIQEGAQHFDELIFVDRAAVQFEVHADVVHDGR